MHTLDKLCQARVDLDQAKTIYKRYISTFVLIGLIFIAILMIGWFVSPILVAAVPCLLIAGVLDKLLDIDEIQAMKLDAEQEYQYLTAIYDATIYDNIYEFVV